MGRQPLGMNPPWMQHKTDSQDFPEEQYMRSRGSGEVFSSEKDEVLGENQWTKLLTVTEFNMFLIARALIMNPEVMILQKPLRNCNKPMTKMALEVFDSHVRERGLFLPETDRKHRRPRTLFFSATRDQARESDVIWQITPKGSSQYPCTVEEKLSEDIDHHHF